MRNGIERVVERFGAVTCNALQPFQIPLRDALLAWCRRRVRPVAAGRLTGRAWPAAGVTWARSSASTAAAFNTARTGTLAAATASATLCHDDLRRRVIPAPAKATPSAYLLAHNCVPICVPILAILATSPRDYTVAGSPGAYLERVRCALSGVLLALAYGATSSRI